MSLHSFTRTKTNLLEKRSPIERDPRFHELFKEYKCKIDFFLKHLSNGKQHPCCLHGFLRVCAFVRAANSSLTLD